MFTASNLHQALKGLGIHQPGDIFNQLAIAYSEPWRHYHNQTHISECLQLAHQYWAIATHPLEIEVALWFHDAIYVPHRQDNEENSAQWAQQYLSSVSAETSSIDRIVAMILATKSHQGIGDDIALLLDIDLSILGASPQRFNTYDQAIRQEYQWIPESQYCLARCHILESFLQRESLYYTPELWNQYEIQGRQNLRHKVHTLQTMAASTPD